MTRLRKTETDIFTRRPIIELRARLNRHDVIAEADIAGVETFMEATIAAAMVIAHADGEAELVERRRIISLFRSNPMLQGFSADDIAREIAAHAQAFELDVATAVQRAHVQIETADLTTDQFKTLLSVCVAVLEADGVRHPAEEDALARLAAMRPWGSA